MSDHENSKSLREAMDAAAKAMNLINEDPRPAGNFVGTGVGAAPQASPPARSDGERLLDTAQRLLRSRQAALIETEAAFERKRIELVCHYRGEIARLEQEVEDELSQLTRAKAREIDGIRHMIDKLKALRDG